MFISKVAVKEQELKEVHEKWREANHNHEYSLMNGLEREENDLRKEIKKLKEKSRG